MSKVWGHWITLLKNACTVFHKRLQFQVQHILHNIKFPSSINCNYWYQNLLKFFLVRETIKPDLFSVSVTAGDYIIM